MHIKNPKDFWSGVMFATIGFAFAIIVKVYEYPMGSAGKMGAGYFPFVLGTVLGLLGVVILLKSLSTTGGPVGKFAWRPLGLVLLGVLAFALALKLKLGMVVGIYAVVIVASLGGHEFKLREVLINATVLAVFSVLVFPLGLKLPIPILPSFLS